MSVDKQVIIDAVNDALPEHADMPNWMIEAVLNAAGHFELVRALELACEEVVAVDEQHCPEQGCVKANLWMTPEGCKNPPESFKYCWQNYFIRQAKKELGEQE